MRTHGIRREVKSVFNIGITLTDGSRDGRVEHRLHRKGQRFNTVATINRMEIVSIDARGCQQRITEAVRQLIAVGAQGHRAGASVSREHRQSERHRAVATCSRSMFIRVSAHTSNTDVKVYILRHVMIRDFRLTHRVRIGNRIFRIHNQRNRYGTVTTMSGTEMNGLNASFRENAVPNCIGQLAFANGMCCLLLICRIHIQCQIGNLVTTIGAGGYYLILTSLCEQRITKGEWQVTVTDVAGNRMRDSGSNHQLYMVNAVASERRSQLNRIIALALENMICIKGIRQTFLADLDNRVRFKTLMNIQMQINNAVTSRFQLINNLIITAFVITVLRVIVPNIR